MIDKGKDIYNNQFIDADKMEICVQDVLIAMEQHQLRMMEREIVLEQAKLFLKQKQTNLKDQSILTDQVDQFGKILKNFK